MSGNFERTLCYPRILPKDERNKMIIILLGKKTKFVCSFFGRIGGLKKTLRLCLTFSLYIKKTLSLEGHVLFCINGNSSILIGSYVFIWTLLLATLVHMGRGFTNPQRIVWGIEGEIKKFWDFKANFFCKGQIKLKSRLEHYRLSKKRTNEVVLGVKSKNAKKKKQVRSFVFWENLQGANLFTVLSDLFCGRIFGVQICLRF